MAKWAVKIEGNEYETDIDELRQWVVEGRVLPDDLIFRQGLGWKKAGEVPALREAFAEQRKKPPVRTEQGPEESGFHLYRPVAQNPYENLGLPTLNQRAVGYSIDMMSYSLFSAPGWLLDYVQRGQAMAQGLELEETASTTPLFIMVFGFVVHFILNVYLTGTYGCSVGKRLIGTVVLDEKKKSFLGYGKAAVREALRLLAVAPGVKDVACCLIWLPSVWLVFDAKRQQLYDKLIGANVYDKTS